MNTFADLVERFHHDSIIVDAHLDLLYDLYNSHRDGKKDIIKNHYLDDFRNGGVNVIIAAIFIDTKDLPEAAVKHALGQIAAFYEELETVAEHLSLCRSYDEIQEAVAHGKVAIILSFEGVEPLGDNVELLQVFYQLGLRGLGICWSRKNLAADGALYTEFEQGQKAGLSNLGYRLVREAERLGMFIDVSHLNDEGFEDIKKITSRPFIASHSNCRSLRDTERNLSDDQIREIGLRGGVIGVNACNALVADSLEKATVSALAGHIRHIANIAGIEHVGLGFDFIERIMPPDAIMEVGGTKITAHEVVKGYSGVKELTSALFEQGFSEREIRLIYGENFMRLFRKVLK